MCILGIDHSHSAHRDNLLKLIPDVPSMRQIDLLVIAGDLFDRLLNLSSQDVYIIHAFFITFLVCIKYDITVRVLEGTPSHDNKQNRWLMEINRESKIGCDVEYFDDLAIEYIDKFDITVLYVPDEYHPDPNVTLKEVRELLANKNLEQADIAVMHGQFDYQVPTNLRNRIVFHDSKSYLDIVKYLIMIGHVHTSSSFEKIVVAGSTDRLKHGEEEDKGILRIELQKSGDFNAEFIVNEGAQTYKTIDVMVRKPTRQSRVLKQSPNQFETIAIFVLGVPATPLYPTC